MDRRQRLLEKLRRGHVQNVSFEEFCDLVRAFGFTLDRIRGSHHHYYHPTVPRPLTVQPHRGEAKPPQIKQFLGEVRRYNLTMGVSE